MAGTPSQVRQSTKGAAIFTIALTTHPRMMALIRTAKNAALNPRSHAAERPQ